MTVCFGRGSTNITSQRSTTVIFVKLRIIALTKTWFTLDAPHKQIEEKSYYF